MSYLNPWTYQGKIFDSEDIGDYIGFVYCITNKKTKKKYIGKKLFYSSKKIVRKRKKTRRCRIESDWKTYYGSNRILLEDISEIGETWFEREILHLCMTKGECSYHETKEQLTRNVLLLDNDYYNTYVGCRINRKHLKLGSTI